MQNVTFADPFRRTPDVVLLDEKQWLYVQRRYRMSPRELQVAKLACQGFTNGDVAARLKVKPGTVKTHLRSVFGKTRVRNRITMLLKFIKDASELPGKKSSDIARIAVINKEEPFSRRIPQDKATDKEVVTSLPVNSPPV